MQLPEIVAVGIYDSKIAARNTAVSRKRKTSMFEIELSLSSGGISYMDSNSKQITANTVLCAKPNQMRHTKFPFSCYYVHMIVRDGEIYEKLIQTPDFFDTEKTQTYRSLFEKMVKLSNAPSDHDEILLQSLILELIYTICKDSNMAKKYHAAYHDPTVEMALRYIKENLTEDLSLVAVARSVSLSPIYFHNQFKWAVGKTLREYVEEQRIKKAIHLLQTTSFSLTKIAYECGFSSQSYFSFVFKRKMKMTPREYVKESYERYEL